MNYKEKYIKYKIKYLTLKYGGGLTPIKRKFSSMDDNHYKKLDDLEIRDNMFILRQNEKIYHGFDGADSNDNAKWFTLDPNQTKQYGSNIAEYNVNSELKVLDLNNPLNISIIRDLLNDNPTLLQKFNEAWGNGRLTSRETDLAVVAYLSILEGLNFDGIATRGYKNVEEGDHHDEICLFQNSLTKITSLNTYKNEGAEAESARLANLGRDQFHKRQKNRIIEENALSGRRLF